MALVAITATPQPVTILSGTPVTVSAPVTLGFSSGTAASGPTMATGTFLWPGTDMQTLYVATATTANLNYIS